jgi:hypothetical protein
MLPAVFLPVLYSPGIATKLASADGKEARTAKVAAQKETRANEKRLNIEASPMEDIS